MKNLFSLVSESFIFTLLLFCAVNATAQNDYFPAKKDSQTVESYQKFKRNLTKLYANIKNTTNNKTLAQLYVNKASILAALGENNADTLFTQVSYAYALDSVGACYLLNHFNTVGSYGFRDNYKRIDALNWSMWCAKCQPILAEIKKKIVISVRDSACNCP